MEVIMELPEFCKDRGVTLASEYIGRDTRDDSWEADGWTCRLGYRGHKLTLAFHMGTGHQGRAPEVAEVVSSILLDADSGSMDFAEFCREFGYDEDSRKAEKTWKACVAMKRKVDRFFGEDIEEFREAAQGY